MGNPSKKSILKRWLPMLLCLGLVSLSGCKRTFHSQHTRAIGGGSLKSGNMKMSGNKKVGPRGWAKARIDVAPTGGGSPVQATADPFAKLFDDRIRKPGAVGARKPAGTLAGAFLQGGSRRGNALSSGSPIAGRQGLRRSKLFD